MTPAERLRRLLKPIPRPPMHFLDLGLASDYAKRAISAQLRADTAAARIKVFFPGPELPPGLEDEIERRADLFRKRYAEAAWVVTPDWSPRAAAMESLLDDLMTGRYAS